MVNGEEDTTAHVHVVIIFCSHFVEQSRGPSNQNHATCASQTAADLEYSHSVAFDAKARQTELNSAAKFIAGRFFKQFS